MANPTASDWERLFNDLDRYRRATGLPVRDVERFCYEMDYFRAQLRLKYLVQKWLCFESALDY